MFNAFQFNSRFLNPAAVRVQVFQDSISVVKVTDGVDATGVLARNNALAGLGGRTLVGPTTKLIGSLSAVAGTITVNDAVFLNGDVIVLQTATTGVQQTEYMTITSAAGGTGPYTYSVTRNIDGSGADSWNYGDIVVGLGQTGQSFIDLYSSRGLKSATESGPTMVGNVRNSGTYNDWTPRWAIGNLKGLYGYIADTYGAAFGVPTGAWVKIDPANGVRVGFNATTKMQIDATGAASFAGAITASSGNIGGWTAAPTTLSGGGITLDAGSGLIYVGLGGWANTSTGFFVDGTGRFSLKDKLTWDGTNLIITTGNVQISPTAGIRISGSTLAQSINFASGGGLYNVAGIAVSVAGPGATELLIGSGYVEVSPGTGTAYLQAPSYKVNGNQVVGPRGAAIPDTSGATLAQLEATVNVVKAAMRTHGLIA